MKKFDKIHDARGHYQKEPYVTEPERGSEAKKDDAHQDAAPHH